MSERQGGMRCLHVGSAAVAGKVVKEPSISQATIAARFERPGIADEFRLDAKDLWDNGHRQVDSLSDAFPPFSMEPDSTSLDLRKNAAQICDVLVPVLSEQAEDDAISLSTPRTSDNGPKNGGANTSPGINLLGDGFRSTTTKTRAQIEACYEILQKHFRIADPTQLEDHLDLYWTILHNSIAPSLGLPIVVPVKHKQVFDVDISPESASSPLSLPGRSTSFRPEDEYSPLDLQYPPSPPIYPSSWGRESPRGRLDFNPCRNVPGLWFVKVGADASKILEVEFVFEPEFIPGLDPPQTEPSASAAQENPAKSKLSVTLLCLRTTAVSSLYTGLEPTNPTPERMAAAVASLEIAWPRDGTLFLGMNHGGSNEKSWLPYEIDPSSPLDVTSFIQPGVNIIRLIQLTGMTDRTFILPHAHHVSPLLIPSKTKIAEWIGVRPAAGLARPVATIALNPSAQAGHQRNRRRRAPGTRRPRSPELQVHGSERAPDSTTKSPKEKTDASTTGSEAETTPDRTRLFCPHFVLPKAAGKYRIAR
ncbi:hypothetical protein B0H13DRAFT_2342622 [Mycena leptocephala]|nr:hypothetical protein B0H13DRAFT_2342622 [Mycena leptocephala]